MAVAKKGKKAKRTREYVLRIDAYNPRTIPMVRLAEYMANLATLLGEHQSVHFVRLDGGSTQLVHAIEREAEPKVRARLQAVRNYDGPPEAQAAAKRIDQDLAGDNASGVLIDPTAHKLIEFPGKKRFMQPEYGPFNQPGTVDGVPIRVGGENDPVPVHLEENGEGIHICYASRAIAVQIAPLMFTTLIRVEGVGRWHRDRYGEWVQDRFTIHGFQKLREASLSEIIGRMRQIPGGIQTVEDPLHELHAIRYGNGSGEQQ